MTAGRGTARRWSTAAGRWILRRSGLVLLIIGPVLALLTAYALSDAGMAESADWVVKLILLADVCYVLSLGALIAWRVGALLFGRRRRSAGTYLHLRLAGVFAAVALVPTVLVAIFAALTLGFGLESLFTDRIGSVVHNSLSTAEAYEREHRGELRTDLIQMATDLDRAAIAGVNQSQMEELITKQSLVRDLSRAYILNLEYEIIARGDYSYLFNFIEPTAAQIAAARSGELVIIADPDRNELRGMVALTGIVDSLLYVSRPVQGEVLRLLDETRGTVQFYDRLERERGSVLFQYALIYLGFALIVILGAIVFGLWFAERLAKPVGRLAVAAETVGAGDLDVWVKESKGEDEIAMLGRAFNRMTGQLKRQRDDLITTRDETERRRQFIEAVLLGVTAGVIGIDRDGRIDLVNEAAAEMLGLAPEARVGASVLDTVPGFAALLMQAREAPGGVARGEVREVVRGEARDFVARVAPKSPDAPEDGTVLTFDDMTALASAQRMAAWGDVARRIAHEIKNPLTPIQLSADRMRRKLTKQFGEEGADFGRYLDVITRQAGDIRRMVDEFSRFARMPEPQLESQDLSALLRESVLLQQEAQGDIDYRVDVPERSVAILADRGLMGQVLTNLLQNAADAIEGRAERDGTAAPAPVVLAEITEGARSWRLSISDNGIGLPKDNRDRLVDPYVTTRAKGTGLGLAIVTKIIEQHGGDIALGDAAGHAGLDGAQVTVRLPRPAGRAAAGDPDREGRAA